MKTKLKYIYFEVNNITGFGATTPRIENANILLVKPKTNSNGVWSHTNVTKRKARDNGQEASQSWVNQYWVDLEKYDLTRYIGENDAFGKVDLFVKETIELLTRQVDKEARTIKAVSYQKRVNDWMQECFGEDISKDVVERNHRFLEEALELVQSLSCTKSEAHQLVDYVFNRPWGEPSQECGGVMVTLAALCSANDLNMNECGETELKRIWTKVEQIREKQANKPKHSPLPE